MKYYLHDGNTQSGPFNLEYIVSLEKNSSYHIWYEGLDEWKSLDKFLRDENFLSKNKNSLKEEPKQKISSSVISNGIAGSRKEIIKEAKVSEQSKTFGGINFILGLAFLISISILVVLLIKNSELKKDLYSIANDSGITKSSYDKLASVYPIFIQEMTFQCGTKYERYPRISHTFSSSDAKYIFPIISFYRSSDEKINSLDLMIKILDENGRLVYNPQLSPKGFTYKSELPLVGATIPIITYQYKPPPPYKIYLDGWGSDTLPSYQPGDYTFQVWYGNRCFYEDTLKITW